MIRHFYRMLIPTLFHYHVNSARSNHLLHFNSTTDGIEDGAQYKAVALLFLLNLRKFRILFNRFYVYYHECSLTELFLQLLLHCTSDVVSLVESHLSVHTHVHLNRITVAYLACT